VLADIITVLEALVSILKGTNKLWGLFHKKGAKPTKTTEKETLNTE
jgi:hypothetical protein